MVSYPITTGGLFGGRLFFGGELERVQGIHNNIDPKLRVVFRQESFVAKIIVPFTAIVLVAIEDADASIDRDGFEVVVDQVVAPSVELEGGVGRPFFEFKEGVIDLMVIGYFLQGGGAEKRLHLGFERPGEEAIDVVIAVVGKDEASVEDVLVEMGAFPGVELHQLMTADIAERVLKEVGAFQVDNLFLQVDGQGGVFNQ